MSTEDPDTQNRNQSSSGCAGAPAGASGSGQRWVELHRRGLELGSRATREIASGRYGLSSMNRDLRDWAGLQVSYGLALASLWSTGPGSAPEAPSQAAREKMLLGLAERVTALETGSATKRELETVAKSVPKDPVRKADIDTLEQSIEALEEHRAAAVSPEAVEPLVSAFLGTLAERAQRLQAEQIARDLYDALLPGRPVTDAEIAQASARLGETTPQGQLEVVVKELVEQIDPAPRKKDWEELRNQLFQGLLGRPWERARDYTGTFKERLKTKPNVRSNLAAVTLSLLESSEYRLRLRQIVDAKLHS